MEKPLISFIITYHEEPISMVSSCIESILALSLRPAERQIILIDDGSKISPCNELQRYDGDIIYIRKPNGGISSARNIAMQMAVGCFIQFIDADDQLVTSVYEHCIDIARFSEADMVMFDFCNDINEKVEIKDEGPLSGADMMRNQNIRGAAWSYIFSQSIRKELLFTDGIAYGEDEEFTAQLLLRSEALYTTTARAYLYRKNEASATNRLGKRSIIRRLSDTRIVISRLNTLADRLPINEKTALKRRVAQLTMDYLYNIIRLTESRKYLEHKIESLRREGIFPLPDKNYTKKYSIFRRLINKPRGLSLLMSIIPIMNKER